MPFREVARKRIQRTTPSGFNDFVGGAGHPDEVARYAGIIVQAIYDELGIGAVIAAMYHVPSKYLTCHKNITRKNGLSIATKAIPVRLSTIIRKLSRSRKRVSISPGAAALGGRAAFQYPSRVR